MSFFFAFDYSDHLRHWGTIGTLWKYNRNNSRVARTEKLNASTMPFWPPLKNHRCCFDSRGKCCFWALDSLAACFSSHVATECSHNTVCSTPTSASAHWWITSSHVHARRRTLEVYPTVVDLKCMGLIQLASTQTVPVEEECTCGMETIYRETGCDLVTITLRCNKGSEKIRPFICLL